MTFAPLSPAQQRLWLLSALDGPSPMYNVPIVLRMTGTLDVTALTSALDDVVARHESLRTVFRQRDGVGHQQVLAVSDAAVTLTVVPCGPDELDGAVSELMTHAFDLDGGVPLLARLLAVSPTDHVLVLMMHHIVCDGWSMRPLLGDLARAYRARLGGAAPAFEELPIRYTDFALWQRELLGADDDPRSLLNRQLAYWSEALNAVPEELALPTDRSRAAVASGRGSQVRFEVPTRIARGLRELARANGTTLFMALQAGVAGLLSRLGAGTDIPLGTATAGRAEEGLDDVVGFFVNTIVIRNDVSGDPSFLELLRRGRTASLRAFDHQDVPFDRVVEHLNPVRSRSRNPIYQVTVELHTAEPDDLALPGVTCRPLAFPVTTVKTDLGWDFTEGVRANGEAVLWCELSYATDLFDRATVTDLAAWLSRFLEGVVERPDLPIDAVPLIDPAERDRLLITDACLAHPGLAVGVAERLARHAREKPDAIAVLDDTGPTTYRTLVGRASRTARRLHAASPAHGEVVPVLLERSAAVIAAFLGINTAGCVYLPLDTEAPDLRTAALLTDVDARHLITDATHASQARRLVKQAEQDIDVLVLDDLADSLDDLAIDRGRREELAYVIFTSGSTGRPKGALVQRQGMVNNLLCEAEAMGITGPELVTLTAPLTFDISVWQMFVALIFGGTVRAVPTAVARDPGALFDLVAAERVTVMQVVPSVLQACLDDWDATGRTVAFDALRVLAVTGEALPATLCQRWLARYPGIPLVNCYGPTECSDDVTHSVITADSVPTDSRTPIGRGVRGSRLYVLDERLQPVPRTIPGELYVGGLVVGGGYLNDPVRTAITFVPDPYATAPGARMYRTGDVVRRRRDGQLEFIGRRDHQIKIRGQRIELGEIEHTMRGLDGVRDAVVTAVAGAEGSTRLVAFFTGAAGPAQVREGLAARLSPAMVPAALVFTDSFPLTANGKIDRAGLPAPQFAAPQSGDRPAGREPRNDRERAIHEVFAEILKVDGFGVDNSFFELGGHSLLAVQAVRRIEQRLDTTLRVGALFEHSSVAALATHVDVVRRARTNPQVDGLGMLLPLRSVGGRPPLFCVHPAAGVSWVYSGLLRYLDADQPVYGLQARGLTRPEAATDKMPTMVTEYLTVIRSVQPAGPYHLLGWSFGGIVAHAMATRLQAQGEDVAMLAVLDSYPSGTADEALPPAADDPASLAELLVSVGFDASRLAPAGVTRAQYEQLAGAPGSPLAVLGDEGITALPAVFAANAVARRSANIAVYSGDLLLVVAGDDPDVPDPATWSRHVTGAVQVEVVPCRHGEMMGTGPLDHIGPLVADRLRRAQTLSVGSRST